MRRHFTLLAYLILLTIPCEFLLFGQGDQEDSRQSKANAELLGKIQAAASTDDNPQMRKIEASLLASRGEVGRAVEKLQELPDDQLDPYTMTELAELQAKQGDRGKAIATLQLALKKEPKTALPYVRLGETYLAMGRYVEARTCFDQALQMTPDMSAAYLGLLRVDRATARRDTKRAPMYCSRLLALEDASSPRYAEALDHLKWLVESSKP